MTDVTNFGTLVAKTLEVNTIKAGLSGGNGDLVIQANNLPTNGNVVSGTLHYNSVTPTFQFSSDTQIKGVKDPTDNQDMATKKYTDDNSGGGINGEGSGANITWAASFHSANTGGNTLPIGGMSGVAINVWDGLNISETKADSNITWNMADGILTYTGSTPIKVYIIAQIYVISTNAQYKLLEFTLMKNTLAHGNTPLQKVRGRIAEANTTVTPYKCHFPITLNQNDAIKFYGQSLTHGITTTNLQCQAMTINVFGGGGPSVGDIEEKIIVGADNDFQIYHDPPSVGNGFSPANFLDSYGNHFYFYQRDPGKEIIVGTPGEHIRIVAEPNDEIADFDTAIPRMDFFLLHSSADWNVVGMVRKVSTLATTEIKTLESNVDLLWTIDNLSWKQFIRRWLQVLIQQV